MPKAPRVWRWVSVEISTRSTGAAACSRAARLTVGPTATKPLPRSPRVLTTTSPVSMPTRMCRRTPYRGSISALSSSSSATIRNEARIARWASSSKEWLRPKTAITASPMNFSTTPPWSSIACCQRAKYAPTTSRVSSASSWRDSTVKSTMSAKTTVTSRRCSARGASSSPRRCAQRLERRLDHGVAEHRALRLQRRDGPVDRGDLVGPGRQRRPRHAAKTSQRSGFRRPDRRSRGTRPSQRCRTALGTTNFEPSRAGRSLGG